MTARAWWKRLTGLCLCLTVGCLYQSTTGTPLASSGDTVALVPAEPPTKPKDTSPVAREAAIIDPPADPINVLMSPMPPPSKSDSPFLSPPPAEKDAPLVAALRKVLEDHPDQAGRELDGLDRPRRERLVALLKLTAGVERKALERMSAREVDTTLDHLRELHEQLRTRATLKLQGVCFCRAIHGFGQYEALPADHPFQGGLDGQAGERLLVYAEVRNFSSKASGGGQHETKLVSSLEVLDEQKRCVRKMHLGACVDRSQSPRHDYFLNFQFHVPARLAPGKYTLCVIVQDATQDGPPREAKSSVAFRVGPAVPERP